MALTAVAVGALTTMASTSIYGAVNANQQAQHAKGAAQAHEQQANTLADQQEQAAKLANDKAIADAARDRAKSRQDQIMGASGGKGSTILTSGLGVPGSAPPAAKTLLGQ